MDQIDLIGSRWSLYERANMRRPRWGHNGQPARDANRNTTAADALEARLPPSKPPSAKRKKQNGRSRVERVRADVERMRAEGDWQDARPIHFVALYAWLHTQIYNVEPVDLYKDDAVVGAASACAKLLRDEFGDEPRSMVEFIAWCWLRERQRQTGRRITWRLQFASRALLVDYRVIKAQRVRL